MKWNTGSIFKWGKSSTELKETSYVGDHKHKVLWAEFGLGNVLYEEWHTWYTQDSEKINFDLYI